MSTYIKSIEIARTCENWYCTRTSTFTISSDEYDLNDPMPTLVHDFFEAEKGIGDEEYCESCKRDREYRFRDMDEAE